MVGIHSAPLNGFGLEYGSDFTNILNWEVGVDLRYENSHKPF